MRNIIDINQTNGNESTTSKIDSEKLKFIRPINN